MTAHVKAGLAPPPLEHDPTFGAFITSQIRTLPDWLQPGMQFRDITPLLQNPRTLRVLIDAFVYR